jgi:uncharacterized protein (UPF0371 family)
MTGKNSYLMSSASALVLNAVKKLADIPDRIHLLPQNIIERIKSLKKDILGLKHETLDLEETLICLSMSSASNPAAELAMEKLRELEGCEVHLTHIPSSGDEAGLRRLRVNLTADAIFPSSELYWR